MNESDTRRKKIDPALAWAGWEKVAESQIFTEQNAYEIAPGRIERQKKSRRPLRIDYLLAYKGQKLAIVEAKSDEHDVSAGVEQAKLYADMMQIRFTYAANGNEIWEIDMKTGKEGLVDRFPSPQELWKRTFATANPWRDKFNAVPFNRGGGRSPRYYQEIAVNRVLDAIADNKRRILLTLATGTGKTYIAFQIAWKLYQAKWNTKNSDRRPRILFLADRNILANQAVNDFGQFDENAICRISVDELKKTKREVSTSRNLYFTIFQTFMTGERPLYKDFTTDFFDLIIIDECHRGGANDESQWREVLEYFEPACQLGLTATPKRDKNVNTYRYFGEPVYVYSLKQGIEDGFLTPYRVRIGTTELDTYQYNNEDTVVNGEVDPDEVYDEQDFYSGRIYIRERDELRVKAFLEKINPDDKTIVFCATQNHAAQVRDMINQHSKHKHPFYCVRVTANDGTEGDNWLKTFQDNEKTIPTILTTSQKLSTGVDARNVRNIVLMRPVNNIIEFKQIIGRGTRLYDDKFYFTIYDFVGAYKHFEDPEWDGEPIPDDEGEKGGNGDEGKGEGGKGGGDGEGGKGDPQPCPICGNWPCTCPGGGGKRKDTVVIKLSDQRQIEVRNVGWDERFVFDGRLIGMDEFIRILFGRLPQFFKSDEDLREQWSDPTTRQALLDQLDREGFPLEKLKQVQYLVSAEDCDLLDVLEFLAYHTSPIERKRRVQLVRWDALKGLTTAQQQFVDFIMEQYIKQGFIELSLNNLPELIRLKYGTVRDASASLGNVKSIHNLFIHSQHLLYAV